MTDLFQAKGKYIFYKNVDHLNTDGTLGMTSEVVAEFENGKTYEITNRHGVKTIAKIRAGKIFGENGAPCGSLKKWFEDPRALTCTYVEINR